MARLSERISYARSLLLTAPLIFVYTGVMGTLSLAGSIVDSHGRFQHGCSRIWAKMILWTARVKVHVYGLEHVQSGMPYVLCVNHQSHMDIPIVLAALPFQFRFTPKKQLFRYPFLGWHLRRSGHVAIDREHPLAAVRSLRQAAGSIRNSPLVIFPEGGTSRDGSIKPFKGGGFMLAAKASAQLVPVTIRGSRTVLVPQTYHVKGGNVEVIIGKPISSEGESASELAKRVREEIGQTFTHGQTLDRHSYSIPREV